MTSFAPSIDRVAAETDKAQTFAESDVTITTAADTKVNAESLELQSEGSSVTFPNDNGTLSNNARMGVILSPNVNVSSVECTISNDSSQTTASDGWELVDHSDGSLLASDTASLSPGDTITVNYSMTAGSEYRLLLYDSSNFDADKADSSKTSSDMDVPHGYYLGERSDSYCFDDITVVDPPTSGTVYVEWPLPADLYGWDTVLFQSDADGETVDVYAEEDQSGGWTEIAGPVKRGDAIPADPANNVRYRVELSRTNTANNPRLEAIYRRFKL